MALPTAIVTVTVKSLDGLPAASPGAGNTRYARATFGGGTVPSLLSGRSRPIPDAGGSFDLTPEKAPWVFEARVDPGTDVSIQIELREDHGDQAGPAPVLFDGKVADPWRPGVQTLGAGPTLNVEVTRLLVNPTDQAFLARAAAASGKSGALAVPQGYMVEFVSIDGLYQPDPSATPPTPGSKGVPGYISDDHLGRIFTNRKPDGSWANDTQFIDVTAKVTSFGGLTIPAAAQVHWTIDDLDDPTNDDPEFHRDWGRYVDANDFDTAGNPLGATPGDNAGAFRAGNTDEDKLFGTGLGGVARWAAIAGGPTPSGISRTEATSPLNLAGPTSATTSVRVHCTNVGGTNLVLRAGLDGAPAGSRIFPARTGVMTMWNRVQVELVKMQSAHSLANAVLAIPKFFLPMCVQMDFELERSVGVVTSGGGKVNLDKKELAPNPDLVDDATRRWVDNANVFTHANKAGWFFLGAARFASPMPALRPPPIFTGTGYTLGVEADQPFVEVPGSLPKADFMRFQWKDSTGGDQTAPFHVWKVRLAAGKSRIFLRPNDVQPLFTGDDSDGSIAHAYATSLLFYPQHQNSTINPTLVPGGLGVPGTGAQLEILGPGGPSTTGISPPRPDAKGKGEFFAGRTVVFTHTRTFSEGDPPVPKADFDTRVLQTVVHEFTHAFGMPHKCGYWNWRTPRSASCCMNYFSTWLIDPVKQTALPGTVNKQGPDVCGRHLMEVRRVHLNKNKGLGW